MLKRGGESGFCDNKNGRCRTRPSDKSADKNV